jgi:hypothetical protein
MVGGKKEKERVGSMGMLATDGAPCMCCMTIGFAVAIHIATWNAGRSVASSLFFHSRLHGSHYRNADWMLVPHIGVWLWFNRLPDAASFMPHNAPTALSTASMTTLDSFRSGLLMYV